MAVTSFNAIASGGDSTTYYVASQGGTYASTISPGFYETNFIGQLGVNIGGQSIPPGSGRVVTISTSNPSIVWSASPIFSSWNLVSNGFTPGGAPFGEAARISEYGPAGYVISDGGTAYATSLNGTTWTLRNSLFSLQTPAASPFTYIAGKYVFDGGFFGSGAIATSTDGVNWTTRNVGFGSTAVRKVVYGNGIFVAAGGGQRSAGSSNEGASWTDTGAYINGLSVLGLGFANNNFFYFASNSSTRVGSGFSWTTRISNVSFAQWSVAYGNPFYVVGASGGRVYVSTNLTSWTERTTGFPSEITSMNYVKGFFVAGGRNSSSEGKFYISTNTVDWTLVSAAPGSSVILKESTYDSANDKFIGFSNAGQIYNIGTENQIFPEYLGLKKIEKTINLT